MITTQGLGGISSAAAVGVRRGSQEERWMARSTEAALWDAYRATSFEAQTPVGCVRIRVDCPVPSLDRLLDAQNQRCWAYVTAWNPQSKRLADAKNREANELLRRELQDAGYTVYSGRGKPDDPAWEPETSMLAIGVSREEALQLGRRFRQNAVVWGERGGRAELLDCRNGS